MAYRGWDQTRIYNRKCWAKDKGTGNGGFNSWHRDYGSALKQMGKDYPHDPPLYVRSIGESIQDIYGISSTTYLYHREDGWTREDQEEYLGRLYSLCLTKGHYFRKLYSLLRARK
jgi:hypothetical protein